MHAIVLVVRTEIIPIVLTDPTCTSAVPLCIEVPPLPGTQTLVLAVPFSLMGDSTPDILCPIHPASNERCVDLRSCNRFSESDFAHAITICRAVNNDSILEMCLHNVTEALNETKVHFFYSHITCNPDGSTPESSRTYISSLQLLTIEHQELHTTAAPPEVEVTTDRESPPLDTGALISD